MTVFVVLLIFLLLFLLWPRIIAWLRPHIQAWMLRRIRKHIFRAAGIPDDEPKGRGRKKQRGQQEFRQAGPNYGPDPYRDEPIIPREYAEDVEFTEAIDYSTETTIDPDGTEHTRSRIHTETRESQVSDAEWEEIKPNKR